MIKTPLFFIFMLSYCGAHAQIYTCKDASGRTITSDRIMPECSSREVHEYGRSGVLKRNIPAPLTAEEKRQKQLVEEKNQAELVAAEERKKSDRAILARFHKEEDIAVARKRSIEVTQVLVTRGKSVIDTLLKELKQVKVEAETYTLAKTKVPTTVQYRLDQTEQSLEQEIKILKENEAEIDAVNVKFDQILKRYRELSDASGKK